MGRALSVLALWIAVAAVSAVSPARAADTALECELLGAVVQNSGDTGEGPLYLAAKTGADMVQGVADRIKAGLPALEPETLSSFNANNESSYAVDCAKVLPAGRKPVVSKHRVPAGATQWSFSRAGIDAAGTQAIFYAESNCGPVCAEGSLYLLTRKDGAWSVAAKLVLWVS